jgi:hypothetical protein
VSGSCRSGWSRCRLRERQASPSLPPSRRRWPLGRADTWGRAQLGHAAPPPSTRHSLSLLLPAVTGVPSPRAADPPSHVRPLSFPCLGPATPALGLTQLLWDSRRQSPPFSSAPHLQALSPDPLGGIPRFPPCCLSPPPRAAGLRSGHLSLLSPARWPPGRGSGPVPAGGARPHAPPPPAAPCQGTSPARRRAPASLRPRATTALLRLCGLRPPREGVLGQPISTG